ncbi:mechanosensitive ion channel family protein [Pollutimonas harenae]|uniref:Small-conductance mechanosensitive channel n=1 Tax=Pollutimonas harenae TaxID=657015 RepID=A0A853GTF6_9BURK|nr:mechanosensitive ion channel domain-containing protein [Pollutimonas harenae]NYT86438.1 mechanosensitive ion channel [Pollutimonas harenae]TEA69811.1 mechanosensitive ion channel [Pollutimonas harenae]
MMEKLKDLTALMPAVEHLAFNLVFTLAILVLGWAASSFAGRSVQKLAARSPKVDPTIVPMVYTVTVWSIRIFVIIAVLARFGVQTASIIAVLGAAGLAVGLALQGTLQNIAAGIMLLALRPLRTGEYVSVVGKGDGTVAEVGLFLTRLVQIDGIHLTLPNSLVWGNPIINYSRNATRRLDVEVSVRYGDDLELALRELGSLVQNHQYVLADPEPQVMVTGYSESATTVNMRVWAAVDNYWDLRFDLYRNALQVLGRAGLSMPIPVREVQAKTVAEALEQGGAIEP